MKQKYEPHRRMPTKRTDSDDRDYSRARNRVVIDEHLEEYDEPDELMNSEGVYEDVQTMYERGFHIEMPEE